MHSGCRVPGEGAGGGGGPGGDHTCPCHLERESLLCKMLSFVGEVTDRFTAAEAETLVEKRD